DLFKDMDKPAFVYFNIHADTAEEARIVRDILQGTNSDEAKEMIKKNPELKKIAKAQREMIEADYDLLE
ncbi:MAG: hypothetical protein KKC54_07655, partial [Nanoarchaeota archaeon]|nr:hypothetical protein [Nanoarchaeota archaeon]